MTSRGDVTIAGAGRLSTGKGGTMASVVCREAAGGSIFASGGSRQFQDMHDQQGAANIADNSPATKRGQVMCYQHLLVHTIWHRQTVK
jgi:hypothetical protein